MDAIGRAAGGAKGSIMEQRNCVSAEKLERHGLTEPGLAYVLKVSELPPARKVGSKRRRNMVLDVPMPQLGVSLQAESLSGEFLFLTHLNQRHDITAVFDQPTSLQVKITDQLGRRTRTTYTGDYLVVEGGKVVMYEIKPDHILAELVRARPSDWTIQGERFRYLPAERCLRDFGITHVVVPISSLSPVRSDNLRLLQASRRQGDSQHLRKQQRKILEMIHHEHAIRAGELMRRLELPDTIAILQLIDREQIFAALDEILLKDIEHTWICSEQQSAELLQRSDRQLLEVLKQRPELPPGEWLDGRYHEDVARRLAVVSGTSRLGRHGNLVSATTVRRLKKAFLASNGNPSALEPGWARCGNRTNRIGETHRSFLIRVIREGRSDPNDPSTASCYDSYEKSFESFVEQTGLLSETCVSRATFYRWWDAIPNLSEDAAGKGGRRLENATADAFDPAGKTITATRSFACAHIDHWKADFFVVLGLVKGKKYTARPWITAMVDAYSGEVLSLWVSLEAPSKKSCTMVVRDCVRRHGRLPEMLIVDGGAEFDSVHFALMLATFGVIRCQRPPEDPRFGQEVERLFGIFKTRFAKGLPGAGLSIEQARSVSAAFKSHHRAKLTGLEAFEALEAFVFHGYNESQSESTALGTRAEIGQRSRALFPCSGVGVEWDLKFMVATSIEAPQSSYTLFKGRGINVDGRWYTSPKLLSFAGHKKDVLVRAEPYDSSVVYVCVEGRWMTCSHTSTSVNAFMSDRALIFDASERRELRALKKELANIHTREAAAFVAQKLEEIAKRDASAPEEPSPTSPSPSVHLDAPLVIECYEPLEESYG